MFFKKKIQEDINLLPEAEVSARVARIKLTLTVSLSFLVVLLVTASVSIFVLSSTEARKADTLSKEIDSRIAAWQEYAEEAGLVGLNKAKLVEWKRVSGENKLYPATLEKVRASVPSTVTLSKVEVKQPNSLSIQATSNDPADLYQFVEQLKSQKDFFSLVSVASFVKAAGNYVLNVSSKVSFK